MVPVVLFTLFYPLFSIKNICFDFEARSVKIYKVASRFYWVSGSCSINCIACVLLKLLPLPTEGVYTQHADVIHPSSLLTEQANPEAQLKGKLCLFP